ncbi:NAD-dependent epimerase/dehydratase family protein [Magnetospirillum sp. 15-1]|uniref:NAD-dependent epimerase/dehydratase family protein n=2 Tax=Magnetospirillum sp. 15-1 TaxID=1979370 RepID=UPI000BBCAC93|nr:NAD-dependent epimerase/dehydratase family protein [Magnetospirillum sp. 15-1]
MKTVIVAGGAGFVGSSLALALRRDMADGGRVVAIDNLKRRGSELALERLRAAGVEFVHGDIRNPEDLEAAGSCDLLLDCSAEPSVHAGYGASPAYLINTNLMGTVNCLEHARRHGGAFAFISTSRVYPIAPLRALPLAPAGGRLVLPAGAAGPGWSGAGISEDFPLAGPRSLYGATKLASEMLVEEYRATYGLRTLTYRCGVLAGPWQMGKVDQGFMVLWAARHLYGGGLGYMGFGGHGHQVRDVLHVEDLYDLLALQLADLDRWNGSLFNVGGGVANSISLRELTALCEKATGRAVAMGSTPETRDADIPYYVTDNARVTAATGWSPRRDVPGLVEEICRWLAENRARLEPILA